MSVMHSRYLPSITAALLLFVVVLAGLLAREKMLGSSPGDGLSNHGVLKHGALNNRALNNRASTHATSDVNALVNDTLYEWTLVTTWPKNFPGLGAAPENLAKLLAQMSHGRLKIKVYGANQLVPAMGVLGRYRAVVRKWGIAPLTIGRAAFRRPYFLLRCLSA